MTRGRDRGHRPVLLVVEDDPGVRRVVRDMLRQAGYEVREAVDGRHALEMIGASAPDAILLDVLLPDMTGLEFLDRLRASSIGAIPVITMTGSVLPDAPLREKGARGVLRKPFSLRELQDAVNAATAASILNADC